MVKKEYLYFVSFAQTKERSHGTCHRVISFKNKPTFEEFYKTVKRLNPEFESIAIINFKLLDKREFVLSEVSE